MNAPITELFEVAIQCEATPGNTGTFLRGRQTRKTASPVFQSCADLFRWIKEQENIEEVFTARLYDIKPPQ